MLIDSATLKEPINPKAGSTLNNMRKAELIKEDAADVAPVVHGRWVDNSIPVSMLSACYVCGFPCWAYSFFYCPNCGARMDGYDDAKPEE